MFLATRSDGQVFIIETPADGTFGKRHIGPTELHLYLAGSTPRQTEAISDDVLNSIPDMTAP